VRAATKLGSEATVEDVAAKVLDHVKIMRVFDFVGVREAIGEIRDDLEGRKVSNRKKADAKAEPVAKAKSLTPEAPPVPKRTVVADSEDEDDDDEMLFDTSAPTTDPAPAVQQPIVDQQRKTTITPKEAEPEPDASKENSSGKVKFVLIDNLAQVINPLLKKDYIQGTFHRSPSTIYTNIV